MWNRCQVEKLKERTEEQRTENREQRTENRRTEELKN
jgi:hypothetical protein